MGYRQRNQRAAARADQLLRWPSINLAGNTGTDLAIEGRYYALRWP
jgi:hypothetical protein